MVLLVVLDLALALGAALRLTRFIVADDVPGQWFIKDPLDRWVHGQKAMERYEQARLAWQERTYHGAESDRVSGHVHDESCSYGNPTCPAFAAREPEPLPPQNPARLKWHRYLEGLGCPYCMSVWMSALVVLTLFLAGGPGDAADWWRYVAGFLTLAWLTGHIAARVGDTED